MASSAFAQYQLPDPGFEDWSGETFNNAIQPRYWNYCNVVQFSFSFNFSDRQPGRSGYCVKVQDQAMKVGAIDGGTSPGYVALGHPWAYVPSLTNISGATAGCYGGIDFSHRPDTVTVWIKRTGANWDKENYNIVFYAWKGTATGTHYGNKGNGCTAITHTDEESDVRQALDPNVCTTTQYATEVCEAYLFEKKEYADWTQIRVPVYYFNDEVPDKCNLILSAGNYPAGRASDGLYAGNALYADDVELIYASTIQKLYVNGKEWKGFDPTNTTGVQTYSLGQGATTIPTIEAYRGAGRLTNCTGAYTANFPGRKLGASECQINTAAAAVDGAPVVITVTAEDGSSTSTYQIQFVSQQSSNPRLADIKVDGQTVSGFNPYLITYNVPLPYGTTSVPQITADAQDGATVTITQATAVNGTATISTVAQDGVATLTYTINFSVAQLSDNTLQNILVDGKALSGFIPTKTSYNVSLPLGTTVAPTVTPVSAYPDGAQTITVVKNSLTEGCQITVSAPGAAMPRTYKLTYKIEASSYSFLADIALDGISLEGFEPTTLSYDITLPMGTTALPVITYTAGDPYQSVVLTEGGVDGTSRLVVTADAGNTSTYRLNFTVERSSNSRLAGIALNGEALEGFDSDIMEYAITLPAGTKTIPTITWTTGDDYQSVRLIASGLTNPARVIVTAGDGSVSTYILTFTVEKSASALLQSILVGGEALEGFDPETFDYRYHLETATAPRVTVQKGDGQVVTISQPMGAGVARIMVQPEEGEPNVYTITFWTGEEMVLPQPVEPTYTPSANADLAMIFLGGDSLEGFDPDVLEYTITLPLGTSEQPILTANTADEKVAFVIYTQGEVNADAWIRVVAEDSVTTKDYVLHFPLELSSNTAPEDIDAAGFMSFDPAQFEYTFEVPFGTPFPEVYVTKSEESQKVETSYLDCKTRRDMEIVMTAENGAQATYSIHMIIPSHPDNVLLSVMGDGWGLDSLTLNSQDTVFIPLAYTVDTFAINTVVKAYDDQYVIIRDGGLESATTLWVYSGRPGDPAKVYTLMPKQANPSLLVDLTVNGATIAGFSPERLDYILPIEETLPAIWATAAEGAVLDTLVKDTKHYQVAVMLADSVVNTYTVWYFYTNDIIPNADFSQSAVARYNDAFKPLHWQVPADGDDSYSWALQGTVTTGPEVKRNSDGSIHLETYRSKNTNSIYGSIPGMMTLGTLVLDMASAGGSTSSVSGGIDYRNTPDYLDIEVKPISQSNINNWRLLVTMDEMVSLLEGRYNNLNSWRTERLNLNHHEIVSQLNITINAAHSENAKDLGGITTRRSQMDVRRVSFAYSSALKGVVFAGDTIAPNTDNHFAISVPTEAFGVPALGFAHAVADQSTEISWTAEVAGVRTATIRNYAEDGSYTDYTLTATRPLSTDAGFTLITDVAAAPNRIPSLPESPLAKLYFRTNSVHAKATVEMVADSLILTVIPESGAAVRTIYSAFTHDTIRSLIAGVATPLGQDSTLVDTVNTVLHGNLDLECILIGEDTLKAYSPYIGSYSTYTPATIDVVGVPSDRQQVVTTEAHTSLEDGSDLYYIHVRAGNGEVRVYDVRVTHALPSSDASLAAISVDGVNLTDFAPTTYNYTIQLPAHSSLPDVQAMPNDGNAMVNTEYTGDVVSLVVVAEDGATTLTYTLTFDIELSDVNTLEAIYLTGEELADFDAATLTYNVTLPYGTTILPEVTWQATESYETVTAQAAPLEGRTGSVTLHVVAENGDVQDYVVNFTVALSDNAHLSAINLAGELLSGFDKEDLTYQVSLPYGTAALPEVTYVTENVDATATLTTYDLDSVKIAVVAEDGETMLTYKVAFTILPSENALLDMIFADGEELADFNSETFEYSMALPYGTTELPSITWTAGDEQQTVAQTSTATEIRLTVTAGSGEENEYVIAISYLLSPNNYLADLQLKGKTVEGFRRDSAEYVIVYPVGTSEADLLKATDVVATPEDKDATYVVDEDASHTLSIIVTAPNGDARAYVVHQEILLSDEARLKMIYLNEMPLADFDPDVLEYTYIIQQGATAPKVTAEALDERATVEYGMLTAEDGGSYIEIDGVAEDGTVLTYVVHFVAANWTSSPDVSADEYIFLYVGDGQYKAVTIGLSVQVAIYDMNGHLQTIGEVPVADPNDVTVEVDEEGKQHLVDASPSAAGFVFTVPVLNQPYFYTFFNARNKRVAKGGKFMLVR